MPETIRGHGARRSPEGPAPTERDRGGRSLEEVILEATPDAVAVLDAEGRVVEWNPAAGRIFGRGRAEALGRPIAELILPPGQGDRLRLGLAPGRGAVVGRRIELEARRADGSTFPAELTIIGVGAAGGPRAFVAHLRDVSDRRRADEALRESEARFQAFMDHCPGVAFLKDEAGRYVFVSRAAGEVTGLPPDAWLGKTDEELWPGSLARSVRAVDDRVRAEGRPVEVADEVDGPGGTRHWMTLKFPVEAGTGTGLVGGMSFDVTERRRAEEALRQSEARLQAVLDNSGAVAYLKDLGGRYLLVNRLWAELFGVTKASVVGLTDDDVFPPGIAAAFRANDVRALEAGRAIELEEVAPHADGPHTYHSVKAPLLDGSGRPYATCGISADITARKRIEEALREGEATLRSFYDSSPLMMGVAEPEGDDVRMVSVNEAMAAKLGRGVEEVRGRMAGELGVAPEILAVWVSHYREAGRTGRPVRFDFGVGEGEGRTWHVASVGPVAASPPDRPRFSFVVEDVTERRRAEELTRMLLDSTGEAVFGVDVEGRCTFCNPACLRALGHDRPEDLLGRNMHELIHHSRPDGAPYPESECPIYRALRRDEGTHADDEVFWRADGTSFPAEYHSYPIHKEGRLVGAVVTFTDITGRKRAEAAIAERAALAEMGSEVALALTRCAPLAERLGRCAESLARHLGAALARVWTAEPGGEILELRASAGPAARVGESRSRVAVGRDAIGAIARDRRPYATNDAASDPRVADREWAAREGLAAFAGHPLTVDDRLLGVLAVFARRPLSGHALQAIDSIANGIAMAIERDRAEARLEHQATHDALTGLPNRGLLLRGLEAATSPSRGSSTRGALLLVDLDRFKEINDTFGHHSGDEVLKQLNPRLLASVRGTDLVARLGGDEFGILLDGADEAAAVAVADRALATLAGPLVVEGRTLCVGASVGIALYPEHGSDATSLLRRADVAMYAAKRARAGRVVYAPGLSESSPGRLELAGELRRGIEGGQLRLYYQPKVDLATGRPAGAEALARWLHPRDGLIAPGRFIPLAEETGLIRPLGLWSLGEALRQCRAWNEAGLDPGVAVNLSPENLHDGQIADFVRDLLNRTGAPPRCLTLEVTETAMMGRPAQARAVLEDLHEMGVRISIDDFGTGYSSLAYLKELPVDEVKVDRSFVGEMLADDRAACIVRAVIDLGHNLGLRVVAEGVEDLATRDRLASWGCDSAQGYYFGRPMPPDDFAAWLADADRGAGETA